MKKLFSILVVSVLFLNCGNDDMDGIDDIISSGSGLITAEVNGESFMAISEDRGIPTISAALVQSEGFFSFSLAGIDLDDSIEQGAGIAIVFVGPNFDEVVNGLTIINPVLDPLSLQFLGGYNTSQTLDGNNDDDFDFDASSGFLRITSIDKENQVISGEFEFTVTEENSGQTFEIREGVFNNITYTAQ